MNVADAVVLLIVGAVIVGAVVHAFRARKRRGSGCGCGCAGCDGCGKKK